MASLEKVQAELARNNFSVDFPEAEGDLAIVRMYYDDSFHDLLHAEVILEEELKGHSLWANLVKEGVRKRIMDEVIDGKFSASSVSFNVGEEATGNWDGAISFERVGSDSEPDRLAGQRGMKFKVVRTFASPPVI